MDAPASARLRFSRLGREGLDTFHRLAVDPHVRRYLLDGEVVGRGWCEEVLAASDALFERTGLGLWLLERDGEAVGFAGFHVFEEMGPAPQLLYALSGTHSGRGLATEAARALVAFARARGLGRIEAAVDAPNGASIRVLEKLGFVRLPRTVAGAFGDTLLFELPTSP